MPDQLTGKKLYGRIGTDYENVAGEITASRRDCQLEGCGGQRLMVRWPDGHKTWPCARGIVPEGNHFRIG